MAVRVAVRVGVGVRVRVAVGVAVTVRVTVAEGVGVVVAVCVAVGVGVAVGVPVAVGVCVGVPVGVAVGVAVAVGVPVGLGVSVGVTVGVIVSVGVTVGVIVSVGVTVGVIVSVGVAVGVIVSVGVTVGRGVAVGTTVDVWVGTGVAVGTAVPVGVGDTVSFGSTFGTCSNRTYALTPPAPQSVANAKRTQPATSGWNVTSTSASFSSPATLGKRELEEAREERVVLVLYRHQQRRRDARICAAAVGDLDRLGPPGPEDDAAFDAAHRIARAHGRRLEAARCRVTRPTARTVHGANDVGRIRSSRPGCDQEGLDDAGDGQWHRLRAKRVGYSDVIEQLDDAWDREGCQLLHATFVLLPETACVVLQASDRDAGGRAGRLRAL